jgi:hypothetical protein
MGTYVIGNLLVLVKKRKRTPGAVALIVWGGISTTRPGGI